MADAQVVALPEAVREDVDRAVRILKEAGCTEVYVFGSVAEGEYHEGSDLDLAVRGCPPERFYELAGTLLCELEHLVDLIPLDDADPFTRFLQEEGALVRVG